MTFESDQPQAVPPLPTTEKQSHPGWLSSPLAVEIALLFLVFSAIVMAIARSGVDPDLWGHLRFGLDTLQAGAIARSDPYSYTAAGGAWINHEWLAEVSFALAWQAAGQTGLILLKLLIWLATLGILAGYLLSLGMTAVRTGLVILPALFLMLLATGTIRPHMFTALGFALTLLALVQAEDEDPRWLWGLPLVFAAWANLHGGVLSGLLFLLVWAVVHLITHPSAWKKVLPPVLVSFLATLLNPYGPELLVFLIRTATVARPEIVEWAPLTIISPMGVGYVLAASLTLLAVSFSRPRLSLSRLVLLGMSIVLPLIAQRHIVLFAIAAPLLAGPAFLNAWPGVARRAPRHGRWFVLIPVIGGMVLLGLAGSRLERLEPPPASKYPLTTVALLKQSGVSGNLLVHFNWGQYALWHLSPQIKVSMDGRRETVYPTDVYNAYLRFIYGINGWEDILNQYPTDMVLIPGNSAIGSIFSLLPEWRLVAEDKVSRLYVRVGSPQEAQLLASYLIFQPPPAEFP